jgi:hypothetical protein
MNRLLLGVILLAAVLATACGDSENTGTNATPTVEPPSSSPAATFSSDDIINMTKELNVLYRETHPDGTFDVKPSTIEARVNDLCADDPQWSTEEGITEWRVLADCRKAETATGDATPPAYGYEELNFVWVVYPSARQVMPISPPAHDAQYAVVQPSTIPTLTPFPTPTS